MFKAQNGFLRLIAKGNVTVMIAVDITTDLFFIHDLITIINIYAKTGQTQHFTISLKADGRVNLNIANASQIQRHTIIYTCHVILNCLATVGTPNESKCLDDSVLFQRECNVFHKTRFVKLVGAVSIINHGNMYIFVAYRTQLKVTI